MTWCFSTRASVATVLSTSSCVHKLGLPVLNELTHLSVDNKDIFLGLPWSFLSIKRHWLKNHWIISYSSFWYCRITVDLWTWKHENMYHKNWNISNKTHLNIIHFIWYHLMDPTNTSPGNCKYSYSTIFNTQYIIHSIAVLPHPISIFTSPQMVRVVIGTMSLGSKLSKAPP